MASRKALGPLKQPLKPRHRPLLPLDRRRHISAYGYTQAKALVYSQHGEPRDVLSLHSHSISPPHSNLLTLRTLAAPLNPADINQIQGTYPSAPPFASDLGTPAPAAVPGSEGVFEVVAAGAGAAAAFAKGDWVLPRATGLGTWRTHLQVPADRVQRIDKAGLAAADAAAVTVNPLTALRLLADFGAPAPGDWVVLNGANSAVGRAVLQLARARGIQNIAVVRDRAGDAAQEALAMELRGLGATHVLRESEVLDKGFPERVAAWTGGADRVRLALNCVGGRAGLALAKVLAPGAHHVTYGAMARQPLSVAAGWLIFRDVRFVGFWVSRWARAHPEQRARCVEQLLDMTRRGELRGAPVAEVTWERSTKVEALVGEVQGTLEGYRKGKGVFVFGDT